MSNKVCNEDKSVYGAVDFFAEQIKRRQNLTLILTEIPDLSVDNSDSRQILDLVNLANETGGSIIVFSQHAIWNRLQRSGMTIKIDLPNEEEMYPIIKEYIDDYRAEIPIEWDDGDIREAASILAGVTGIEAENVMAALIAKKKITKADMDEVRMAKDRLFADISGLEKIEVDESVKDVGGLAGLRNWLDEKKQLLQPENEPSCERKACSRRAASCSSVCRAAANPCRQSPSQRIGSCLFIDWTLLQYREVMSVSPSSSSRMP